MNVILVTDVSISILQLPDNDTYFLTWNRICSNLSIGCDRVGPNYLQTLSSTVQTTKHVSWETNNYVKIFF